ncbi:MAG: hypothetical protein PHW77_01955 [Eubacteriales bacterium]|nr:hypothetical protein [Eubacteriales bacterium]
MRCRYKSVGYCVLAFGAGVLLGCFLPAPAMVFVSSVIIVGAGVFIIIA